MRKTFRRRGSVGMRRRSFKRRRSFSRKRRITRRVRPLRVGTRL